MKMAMRIVLRATLLVGLMAPTQVLADPGGPTVVTGDFTLGGPHVGSLSIEASHVTLDCAGHTVTPDPTEYFGIRLVSVGDVVVKNCHIAGVAAWQSGIILEGSNDSLVIGNSITGEGSAIALFDSDDNDFTANSGEGADVFIGGDSDRNLFKANTVVGGRFGFQIQGIDGATENVFTGNTATNQTLSGFLVEFAAENEFKGNVVRGSAEGGFAVHWGDGNLFKGNVVSESSTGFEFDQSNRNILIGNSTDGGGSGFYLTHSDDNTLRGNTATNSWTGISIRDESDGNTIEANTVRGHEVDGILVWGSDGNTISRNLATENGTSGIGVIFSTDTLVARNTADDNGRFGLAALVDDGDGSVFERNQACDNGVADGVDFGPNNPNVGDTDPAAWSRNAFCEPLLFLWVTD